MGLRSRTFGDPRIETVFGKTPFITAVENQRWHMMMLSLVFDGDNFKNSAAFEELFIPGGKDVCAVLFYKKVVTFLD